MILTIKQQMGLKVAVDRYKAGEKYTVIAGYAGSGKSTLVKFIISALEVDPAKDVLYIAYTGCAANVLKNKGCPRTMTAHKALYENILMPDGSYMNVPRTRLKDPTKVVVVDEISMLPQSMWEILLNLNVYILAMGDPYQIDAIVKSDQCRVLDNPHVFLDEIMRQALDNEIIRYTLEIRQMKELKPYKGKDIQILPAKELCDGMLTWADQIICATNKRRQALNNHTRELLGISGPPQVGDKIICLDNSWRVKGRHEDDCLVNGSVGYLDLIQEDITNYFIKNLHTYFRKPCYNISFSCVDGSGFDDIPMDKRWIEEEQLSFSPKQIYSILRAHLQPPIPFDYAYAMTAHKMQGQERQKILLIEERFPFNTLEHSHWLYSAATRASEKLVLILKD